MTWIRRILSSVCPGRTLMIDIYSLKNQRRSQKSVSGFTLLELVIVLVILGVIASFAARPVAQTMEVWVGTMRTQTDQGDLNFALERMARDVRWAESVSSCGENDLEVQTAEEGQPKYTYSAEEEDGVIVIKLNTEVLASNENADMSFNCTKNDSLYTIMATMDMDGDDYTEETTVYCRNCE